MRIEIRLVTSFLTHSNSFLTHSKLSIGTTMNKKLLGMVALACIVGFAGCDDSSSDDAKKACGSVAHDAMTCNANGTQLAKCNDGKLEDLAGEGKCSENQVCAITDGKAACKDVTGDDKKACGSVAHDAMTCNADGTQLAKCNNGRLEDLTGEGKCSENQVCAITDGKAACKDKSEDTQLDCDNAKHGELVCKGDKMAKCVNGDIVDVTGDEACATGKVCGKNAEGKVACFDAGSRPCGSTAHGAKACNGEKIATCNDGKLVNDEGQGVTQCVDRKTHCVANDAEIACVDFKKCGEGDLEINHNSYGCDGERMVLCYDGEKVEPAADRQCTGSTVCRYLEEKGVRYAKCIDPTACDELKNGEKKCNDEGTQVLVCTNGELKEATGDAACTAEQICALEQNAVKCAPRGDLQVSVPSIHKKWDEYINLDTCATTSVIKEGKTKVTGFILYKKSGNFYLQDRSATDGKHAGIRIQCMEKVDGKDVDYCKFTNVKGGSTNLISLEIGDVVTVEADGIGNKGCELVIGKKNADIKVTQREKKGTALNPIVVTASQISMTNFHNDYYGSLVTIKNITAANKKDTSWEVTDTTGTTQILSGNIVVPSKLENGKKYNVTGIVGNYSMTSGKKYTGIKPRDVNDISEIK